MPDLYLHRVFGECVLSRLPEDINIDKRTFMWAQEGPDFWFFWKSRKKPSRNRLMHTSKSQEFVGYLIETNKDNIQLISYALGFLCHIIYDDFAHPYINYRVQNKRASWFCGDHVTLERALDIRKMKENSDTPRKLIRAWSISIFKPVAQGLSDAYNHVFGWKHVALEIRFAYIVRFFFYFLFWDPLWLLYGVGKLMRKKLMMSYSYRGKNFPDIDIDNNNHDYWGESNLSFNEVTQMAIDVAVERIIAFYGINEKFC